MTINIKQELNLKTFSFLFLFLVSFFLFFLHCFYFSLFLSFPFLLKFFPFPFFFPSLLANSTPGANFPFVNFFFSSSLFSSSFLLFLTELLDLPFLWNTTIAEYRWAERLPVEVYHSAGSRWLSAGCKLFRRWVGGARSVQQVYPD